MNRHALITALLLTLTPLAQAGGAGDHDHRPRHGGIVVEGKAHDYELVATPTALRLHLRDHGKPVDVAQASARLTLLNGTTRQEVELRPAGPHLEATGRFEVGPGTKVVAVVTVAGKASTARFVVK
jgi:hypothetical protein